MQCDKNYGQHITGKINGSCFKLEAISNDVDHNMTMKKPDFSENVTVHKSGNYSWIVEHIKCVFYLKADINGNVEAS